MTKTLHIDGLRLWEAAKIGALGVALGVGWGTLSADVAAVQAQIRAMQRQINILVTRDVRATTTSAPPRVGAAGTTGPPPVFSVELGTR